MERQSARWEEREQWPKRQAELADLRFRKLLPAEDWRRLPATVRRRFDKRLQGGDSAVYRGHVVETRMNVWGLMLAWTLRLIGAPLPVERCAGGTPAIVTVTEDPASCGQFWTRQYNRRRGFPQVIQSAKAFAGPTGLEELVGAGVGMSLRLLVEGESLLFVSECYFLSILRRRWHLPRWLAPGHLVVGHHDLGAGWFEFTLDLNHPLLGELLHQRARFRDMAEN